MESMRELLESVAKGEISIERAEKALKILSLKEVGNSAKLDIGREIRKGIPEVIVAEGKHPGELAEIAVEMLNHAGRVIISRTSDEHLIAVRKAMSHGEVVLTENQRARIAVGKRKDFVARKTGGKVGILTAGTSDIPIAEEAMVIAGEMGCEVTTAYDLGVAGIHRLCSGLETIAEKDVDVIVVVAGREGALASLVAGVVGVPVIGVPTSFAYGFGGKGIGALMAMLQACPLGLAVVNIDAGVPAGAIASLIANQAAKFRDS